MKAEDKANELIGRFRKATTYKYQEYAGANYSTFEHDIDTLKACALICVEEIMNECQNWAGGGPPDGWDRKRFDFWEEVKQILTQ